MTHELALNTEGLCGSRDFYLELQLTSLIPRCCITVGSSDPLPSVRCGDRAGSLE